ncbi:MAG: VWA domain-containing protein [Candidatus Marinimicrobia bacterium]|nr:VWA domain-containing protein [Candidatus Neomarinimicrobiota bacterium]
MFYFNQPYFLFLLLIIPGLIYWYRRKMAKKSAAIRFPSIKYFKKLNWQDQSWKQHTLFGVKMVAIALLVLALARPRKVNTEQEFFTEGIDIVLVIDISSSMKALDFKPNRLEAAKEVGLKFIQGRSNDRIGLITFAAESFLQCPLTVDYNVLENFMQRIEPVERKFDGTAIGMAIAHGINRLRDSNAKSKVMILLSDGRNNAGELDPATATGLAKEYGIKIYTIGAGKRGKARIPVKTYGGRTVTQLVDVRIDEKTMQEIAQQTGGKYFRATDKQSLFNIYKEISKMEKTEIKVKKYYNYEEKYFWFLMPGIFLLLMAGIFENSIWRQIP